MEREDLIIRAGSPTIPEQEVSSQVTVVTEAFIPRSTSAEDLQKMVANAPALQGRDVDKVLLSDLKKLMKQELLHLFERSRNLVPDDFILPLSSKTMNTLKAKHSAIRGLSQNDFVVFTNFIMQTCSAPIFTPFGTLMKSKGVSAEELDKTTDSIYSARYLSNVYPQFLRGEKLYTFRVSVNLHHTRFAHNVHPKLLHTQLVELSAEICETVFKEYQDKSRMHQLKNIILCLYAYYQIFPKLLLECFQSEVVKRFCDGPVYLDVSSEFHSIFNWDTPRHGKLWDFRNEHLGSLHTADELLKDFLHEFDIHQKQLLSQPFYSLMMKYAEFYISRHESLAAALDNPNAFSDDLLLDFRQREGFDVSAVSRSCIALQEAFIMSKGRYHFEYYYFSRDRYRLDVDMMIHSNMVLTLQQKYAALMTKKVRQDLYVAEIYAIITPLFQKLKLMDLASPTYTRDDVNLILKDLRTLRFYLDTLTGLVDLIKSGDLKIDPQQKKKPSVKKKKPVKKKKAPAPIIAAEVPVVVPVAAPKKGAPPKLTPQKREDLESIRAISERIKANIERENQFYKAAKAYILSLMSNAQARGLVELLFNPKSNLKNIMNQKDMTLIVEQMSARVSAISENLKGSNGFRFRVGDEIYTSHASSAEIGHKGHGGAVKGFRDFLIAVYALSLKA